jgi:hypothetical protein
MTDRYKGCAVNCQALENMQVTEITKEKALLARRALLFKLTKF